jgi:hypothetical protein
VTNTRQVAQVAYLAQVSHYRLHARVCEDYPKVAPLCATSATRCELIHDWQAMHPRQPRREPGAIKTLELAPAVARLAGKTRIRDLDHGGQP